MIWFYLMVLVPLAGGICIALVTNEDLEEINRVLTWITMPVLVLYLLVSYLLISGAGGAIWLPFIVIASLQLWPILVPIFFHAGWVIAKECRNRIRTNRNYH